MAQTVASHAVAALTSPVNGDALSATVVLSNDNTVRAAFVNHDADPGIHLQSSALASRPAAGTAGRKWLSADTSSYRLFFDTGTAWQELTYLRSDAGGTVTGNVTVTGALTVTGAVTGGSFVGPLTGNASTATALQTARAINGVNFDGTAAITVTAAAGTLTGATLAANVLASSLTSVGTLASLVVGGTLNVGGTTTLGTTNVTGATGLSTTALVATGNTTLANTAVGGAVVESTTALHLPASTTAKSSVRIPNGVAPTPSASGDMWLVSSGQLRIKNGVDEQYASWTEQGAISIPSGGATQDTEARAAITAILGTLQAINIIV